MDKLKTTIRHYSRNQLSKANCPTNPFELMRVWLDDALKYETYEPNAMTLATVDPKGQPSSRIVLLKELIDDTLIFYTNYRSKKSQDITQNEKVSALFWWPSCERQLRVEGIATKTSAKLSNAYFTSRGKDSKLGAHASEQSSVIAKRKILDKRFAELQKQYADDKNIPRPDHWGGYVITPKLIEFWQGGAHRLHDRICYRLEENATWHKDRLAP